MKTLTCFSAVVFLSFCAGATQVAVAQTSKPDGDEESSKLARFGTYKITIDDAAAGKWLLTADIAVATPATATAADGTMAVRSRYGRCTLGARQGRTQLSR